MKSDKPTNGNGDSKIVIICTTNAQQRWAYFAAEKEPPRKADVPFWLSKALGDWIRDNPTKLIRSSLGIVSDGMTVAIHVWYDEIPEPGG